MQPLPEKDNGLIMFFFHKGTDAEEGESDTKKMKLFTFNVVTAQTKQTI